MLTGAGKQTVAVAGLKAVVKVDGCLVSKPIAPYSYYRQRFCAAPDEPGFSTMNKTALVIDDSRSARFALRKFLESLTYRVEVAESAQEAYRILADWQPSVVFLDHLMPGVDGFDALHTLKRQAHTTRLPVVICSSNEGETFVQQAKSRGAFDVLQKPPSPEQLLGVLERLSNRSAEENEPATLIPPAMNDHALVAVETAAHPPSVMERLMATLPPRVAPAAHGKVQSLRDPAVLIQQAAIKSLRDHLPETPVKASVPAPALPPKLPVFERPALTHRNDDQKHLRQEFDERLDELRRQMTESLAALRRELTPIAGHDSELRTLATEAAERCTQALAGSLEQHLTALREALEVTLQQQNTRVERVLAEARQAAAEEAERTVTQAAQRIADQMAESLLKALGPQLGPQLGTLRNLV